MSLERASRHEGREQEKGQERKEKACTRDYSVVKGYKGRKIKRRKK
jgi:hypothetical protein